MEIKPLIVASIGWVLLLTIAVISTTTTVNSRIDALAFNMNNKFEAVDAKIERRFEAVDAKIERRFEAVDRKIDGLQNLIVQHIILHPEAQDAALENQPVEELKPTG